MAILPEEVFKRRPRHNNTPEWTMLTITNFIVIAVNTMLFTSKNHINLFFWIVVAALALYNVYVIRRNPDEFGNKIVVIAYVISLAALVALFLLFKGQ
jgi:hypothetical protein